MKYEILKPQIKDQAGVSINLAANIKSDKRYL